MTSCTVKSEHQLAASKTTGDDDDNLHFVMPGQHVRKAEQISTERKLFLGPGVRRRGREKVIAQKAGPLIFKEPATFWIDNYQRRYIPLRNDTVIGVVHSRAGDNFRVDIGAHEHATISYLSFEGATKKNRPDIKAGDLLLAKVINAGRDMETELVCMDALGKKDRLGVLADGLLLQCSRSLLRKIMRPNCPLINGLKREMPFEIAFGMNGRVWINANTTREIIAIGNALQAAEVLPNEEIMGMCEHTGNLLYSN